MPFDLKRFIRAIHLKLNPPQKIIEEPVPAIEEDVIEPKQNIDIPVYDPALDEDYDILPPVKKRTKNQDISRKVTLNPLSD